jgi:hypothetical protein
VAVRRRICTGLAAIDAQAMGEAIAEFNKQEFDLRTAPLRHAEELRAIYPPLVASSLLIYIRLHSAGIRD